ncbi:hypothetical protein GALMADRAFT_214011 [Galerina marginata CBS 339.88]|uniref:Uncharacterized protein n=1 Tax=Galerina marginata (strain CBS 339.88) TaxID=685588 RepID=A0A067SKD8_GALM3|nr:hypothetical protein GALMADRAFT_214011 [Galerina marginata CBS 339.88]
MSTFDVSAYNDLPFIADANARFEDQLASAGLTRSQFFKKLAPVFLEAPYIGHYAACLIHRHYSLNDGERMVTNGPSARPSTETSANIVGERWASNGEVIEFKFTDDPASHAPHPPAEFFAKFKSIVDAHGIDMLGVCYAPGKLADDYLFLESPGPEDREQVTHLVHSSASENKHSFEASWIPNLSPDGVPCMVDTNGAV